MLPPHPLHLYHRPRFVRHCSWQTWCFAVWIVPLCLISAVIVLLVAEVERRHWWIRWTFVWRWRGRGGRRSCFGLSASWFEQVVLCISLSHCKLGITAPDTSTRRWRSRAYQSLLHFKLLQSAGPRWVVWLMSVECWEVVLSVECGVQSSRQFQASKMAIAFHVEAEFRGWSLNALGRSLILVLYEGYNIYLYEQLSCSEDTQSSGNSY